MSNHPIPDHSAYYAELGELADEFDENLGHIRAEQDSGRITPAEAAAERCQLLEAHLERLAALREQYFGQS